MTLRHAGDSQFRPGEIIPIELVFDSKIPKRFAVDGAGYDRSGRLTIDEFRLSPIALVTDPMLDYFAAFNAFIGGGIRGMGTLGDQPYTVPLQLNEWFRFDTPGIFALSVRTNRVTDELIRRPGSQPTVPVESNAITFEILPRDPQWESNELERARRLLSDPQRTPRGSGCRILRFLGTPAAIDEMVRHYDDEECRWDAMAGLVSAPDRAHAVRQLEAGIQAPDQPVTRSYLQTLAMLSVYIQQPELRPAQTPEAKGRLMSGGELARRPELVQAETERYAQLLEAALPAKRGAARAVSIAEHAEIVRLRPAASSASTNAARQQLVASFAELPQSRQESLLRFQWRSVADPGLAPALRQLAAGPTQFSDLALRRLYQVAPAEGRALILERIQRPTPGSTLQTLGALPEATLPALDDVIARNVEAQLSEIHLAMLHRYASAAIAPRMLKRITPAFSRPFACTPQAPALAYFLRVRPQDGMELVNRALAYREMTGCYQRVLGEVAQLHMTPDLEKRMVAALDDEHPRVVQNAIESLGRFGSESVRAELRLRFDTWSREWQGRAGELQYSPARGVDDPGTVNGMIEFAYLRALADGQRWLADRNDIAALRDRCVTDTCRTNADVHAGQAGGTTIDVLRFDGPTDMSVRLAQYELTSLGALAQKLSQYPKGTTFTVRASGPADTARAITTELSTWAAAQGFSMRP